MVMTILSIISFIILLIFQGGFYPYAYLIVALIGCVGLIISKRSINITKELVFLLVISLAYILSSLHNGISYGILGQTFLPLACFVMGVVFFSLDDIEKKTILNSLILIGIVSSVIAVIMYIFSVGESNGFINVGRLQFTFQYANVAGTWFGVSFILARDSENKTYQYLSVFNVLALLATKSVGAIAIFIILQVIWYVKKSRKNRILLIGTSVALIISAFVIARRFSEAKYTFIERIIQSMDGIKVQLSHCLFGIGTGNWQYLYPYYQSAQYKAGVIHNSYVQAGVSAGLIPMLILIILLVICIKKYIRNYGFATEAALFIMLHSIMDYCMSFAFIDILLVFLFVYSNEEEIKVLDNKIQLKIPIVLCFILMSLGLYGVFQIRTIESYELHNNYIGLMKQYNSHKSMMKNGYRENQLYLEALIGLNKSKKVEKFIENNYHLPANSAFDKLLLKSEENGLIVDMAINEIKKQPYNYELIQQVTKLIQEKKPSDSDKEKYKKYLEEVNAKIKEKPAKWLNNQEEVLY